LDPQALSDLPRDPDGAEEPVLPDLHAPRGTEAPVVAPYRRSRRPAGARRARAEGVFLRIAVKGTVGPSCPRCRASPSEKSPQSPEEDQRGAEARHDRSARRQVEDVGKVDANR